MIVAEPYRANRSGRRLAGRTPLRRPSPRSIWQLLADTGLNGAMSLHESLRFHVAPGALIALQELGAGYWLVEIERPAS
jgi:hypothetical protein